MTPFERKHIRDVDRVKSPYVLIMGAAAGAGVLFFTTAARAWPGNHLDFETLLGSLFTGSLDPSARKFGLVAFLLISSLSAFAYSFIFWSARRSGIRIGVQLSIFHYLISGLAVGILPALHPLIPESMTSPGFFMINTSFATAVMFFLSHVVYGALFGQFFDWAALREEFQKPISTSEDTIRHLYGRKYRINDRPQR